MAKTFGVVDIRIDAVTAQLDKSYRELEARLRRAAAEQCAWELADAKRRAPYWSPAHESVAPRIVHGEWPAEVIRKLQPRRKARRRRARKAQPVTKPKRAISMEPL